MIITNTPPPEWIVRAVKEKWGVEFEKGGVAFTYGDTVHIAEGGIPEDLKHHEAVHIRQQAEYGSAEEWWKRYLTDDQFRLGQELEAYRTQYKWVVQNIKGPNKRFEYLRHYALSLSGGMYGKTMPFFQAIQEIRRG